MPDEEVVEETVEDKPMVDQHGPGVSEEFSDAFDKVFEESEPEELSEDVQEEEDPESAEAEISDDVAEDTETEETSEEEEVVVEQEEELAPEPDEVVSEEVEELSFDLDEVTTDPTVKDAIDKITEELNAQKKSIAQRETALRLEQEKTYENRIDSCFDKFTDDLPSLGASSKLSKEDGMYRRRIFQHAQVEAQMSGVSIEAAIKETVNMFKNKDGEKVTEKKLISKLNKQKSKFTNTPTRKNKNINDRKFANESERKRAVMDKAYSDAGIS